MQLRGLVELLQGWWSCCTYHHPPTPPATYWVSGVAVLTFPPPNPSNLQGWWSCCTYPPPHKQLTGLVELLYLHSPPPTQATYRVGGVAVLTPHHTSNLQGWWSCCTYSPSHKWLTGLVELLYLLPITQVTYRVGGVAVLTPHHTSNLQGWWSCCTYPPPHKQLTGLVELLYLLPITQVTYRVGGVDQLAGLAELDEALLQVGQWSLHQTLLLLVVGQQMVPQRLLQQAHLSDCHVPIKQLLRQPFVGRLV